MEKVNLNLIPGGVRPVVNVSQYDEGRQFQLAIFQGSASYDLTGKTVTIEVGKTDGNGCSYGAVDLVNTVPVVAISGNIVTITTPVQMTACAGENMAELKIAQSGNVIGTLNFILLCEQAALSPNTPISETDIPAIERAGWDAVEHYPYIDGVTNHWIVWDVNAGQYVDSGISAGGGGGVTDYGDLTSKPQINSVQLIGNRTAADLGLATDDVMTGATSGSAGAAGLVPAPSAGDQAKCLRGDGSWGSVAAALTDLTDTAITSPTNGQTLVYDDTTNKWKNGAGGGGGSSTLSGLTDVTISTPTDAQPLTYDNASSKWVNGGIIPTANGGTGNADGYVRTGKKTGTTVGTGATIEGTNNTAGGQYCHVEGSDNTTYGNYTHVEGYHNTANYGSAHVDGAYNVSQAPWTHVSGYYNEVDYDYQTAMGKYNKNESDSLLEIGNGTANSLAGRSNAIAVKSDGRIQKGSTDSFPAASNLAPVEMTRTMTATRSAGSFLFVAADDQFYQVGSSAISSGATLTPGTNATAKSVADVLSALNSDLTNKLNTNYGGSAACGSAASSDQSTSFFRLKGYYQGAECTFVFGFNATSIYYVVDRVSDGQRLVNKSISW